MPTEKICPSCQPAFTCGHTAGSCWCFNYPAIMPVDKSAKCHCPDCLARAIGTQIDQRLSGLTHEEALAEAKTFANQRQLFEHIDYTMENGLLVFTRWHLLKKGKCCGKECRHCPYPENQRPV